MAQLRKLCGSLMLLYRVYYQQTCCAVVAAILILLAGLIYTFFSFHGNHPWYPRKWVKWIRNQKFSSFIENYFIPYTTKYCYWAGLLLLIQVSVYLLSAFNPSGDPRITLSATNFIKIMASLVIYIATFGVRVYENHFINTMESLSDTYSLTSLTSSSSPGTQVMQYKPNSH